MKKLLIYTLLFCCFSHIHGFALGKLSTLASPNYQDGVPKKIGIIYTSKYDPFILNTISALEDLAIENNITTYKRVTTQDVQEQIYEITQLLEEDIQGLIVEPANEEVTLEINELAIKKKIILVYFHEQNDIPESAIPKNRRIAQIIHNTDEANYQISFANAHFKQKNMNRGKIFLLYDENDTKQIAQHDTIMDYYNPTEKTNNQVRNNFSITAKHVESYLQTSNALLEWLIRNPQDAIAILTTNDDLAIWAGLVLQNYKINNNKQNTNIENTRRSLRRTVDSQNTEKTPLTREQIHLNSIIVLGNNLSTKMLADIDNGTVHMALFRDDYKFARIIMNRLLTLARGDVLVQKEIYEAHFITPDNIYEFSNQFKRLAAQELRVRQKRQQELESIQY